MLVALPICHEHRNHWLNRRLFVWLGLLFWLLYSVALGVVWADLPEDAASGAVVFLIFGGLAWLIVGVLYANSGIKPLKITDRWIEIGGVNADFASDWAASEPEPIPRKARRLKSRDEDEEE